MVDYDAPSDTVWTRLRSVVCCQRHYEETNEEKLVANLKQYSKNLANYKTMNGGSPSKDGDVTVNNRIEDPWHESNGDHVRQLF